MAAEFPIDERVSSFHILFFLPMESFNNQNPSDAMS
jgi:hypothetical protein